MSKKETAMAELSSLREMVTAYSQQYYNDGESDVSDSVFDVLKARLSALEHELNVKDKVSEKVGAIPRGETFTRSLPMLSLDNVFSAEELGKWLSNLPEGSQISIEHKLDGMSLELAYEKGKLIRATTRGDGLTGEIITGHAKQLLGVPDKIKHPRNIGDLVLLRGEVVIYKDDFIAANLIEESLGRKVYQNPRNMVAGLLRRNDPSAISRNNLRFICYDINVQRDGVWYSHSPSDFSTVDFTSGLYKLVPEFIGPNDYHEDISSVLKRCEGLRETYQYDIDGLVIKCTSHKLRSGLGVGNSFPHWAIAYKFPPNESVSVLLDVDWQIGRTGVLTPVAKIEPVKVTGVTITNVSLYNPDEIERLGLECGRKVVVARMGDVIPKIVASLPSSKGEKLSIPTTCPGCGTALVRDGVSLVCNNHYGCNEQIVQRLVHFASRPGMDIKGMGEATVRAMVRFGITRPIDLYAPATPLALNYLKESIGDTLYNKLMENVERSRKSPFFKVLRSIGIEDVGGITAEIISNKYNSFKELSEATVEDLENIPYVGRITAESIVQTLTGDPEYYIALDGVFEYQKRNEMKQDLEGLRVVVTGSKFGSLTRQELEDNLKSRGARISGSVSKNTDILYVGSNPGQSKLDKALELGIKIL